MNVTRENMDQLTWEKQGALLPAIVQDADSGILLMQAYMNKESLLRTLESERVTFFSRSRQKIWQKGEESGNTQNVKDVRIDCDGDALLFRVEQVGGAACHTGYESCFYRKWNGTEFDKEGEPVFDPEVKYKSK